MDGEVMSVTIGVGTGGERVSYGCLVFFPLLLGTNKGHLFYFGKKALLVIKILSIFYLSPQPLSFFLFLLESLPSKNLTKLDFF